MVQLISNADKNEEIVFSWIISALPSNNCCIASEPPRIPIVSGPLWHSCWSPCCSPLPARGQRTNTIINNNNTTSRGKIKFKQVIPSKRPGTHLQLQQTQQGTPSLSISEGLCQRLCGNSPGSVVDTKGCHSQLTQPSLTNQHIQLTAKWEIRKINYRGNSRALFYECFLRSAFINVCLEIICGTMALE